jgi:dTDP-4-amino-4,6-dideoxygalactose transaminase
MKKIKYVDVNLQWKKEKKELFKIIDKTISNNDWVGGKEVQKFEKNISKYCGTKYALGLNSGTDALTLALYSLGVRRGDEVITCPNSFIASVSVIVHLGAKPVFVDVLPDQNMNPDLLEKAITNKTKAIMPVHLTGRICEMDRIIKISKKYKIPIIEDAAQAIGAKYKDKMAGSLGEVGCFSAHPLKNLNAIGDSGYLVTNNENIYKKIMSLRSHGIENRNVVNQFGYVSRMDTIQAAILNFRLKNLKTVIKKRRDNADFYYKNLDKKKIFFSLEKENQFNAYHTFVIQVHNRDNLQKYLLSKKIYTSIHYPIPIHLQPASRFLNHKMGDFPEVEKQAKSILTLPIHQNLNMIDLKRICNAVNNFHNL